MIDSVEPITNLRTKTRHQVELLTQRELQPKSLGFESKTMLSAVKKVYITYEVLHTTPGMLLRPRRDRISDYGSSRDYVTRASHHELGAIIPLKSSDQEVTVAIQHKMEVVYLG